jgi:CD109 antigen
MLQYILCSRLGEEYERSIQIDVAVEEALTGRRQNTTFEVMMHRYKYKMELIKTSEYFKPGLKYTAFVSVLLPYTSIVH